MYHNPVGYALGLLDEHEAALRAGRTELAADVVDELARVRSEALRFGEAEVKQMPEDAQAELARLRARLAAFDKPADDGVTADQGHDDAETTEAERAKGLPRTAAKPAAPEAAVKPARGK